MKNTHVFWLFIVAAFLALAGTHCIEARASASAVTPSPTRPTGTDTDAKVPRGVTVYATADIGRGQRCLAGESDKEGMNEKPVVYLAERNRRFAWRAQLHILKGAYQGRATHCAALTDALYVLVQIDTSSLQNANQTLLQVVELSRQTGGVVASRYVDVPNVSADYTSWVDVGAANFALKGEKLVIKGFYDAMSERDLPTGKEPTPFVVEVPVSLRR